MPSWNPSAQYGQRRLHFIGLPSARRMATCAVGSAPTDLHPVVSSSTRFASLSHSSLRRHSSKVGAVCVEAPVRICAGEMISDGRPYRVTSQTSREKPFVLLKSYIICLDDNFPRPFCAGPCVCRLRYYFCAFRCRTPNSNCPDKEVGGRSAFDASQTVDRRFGRHAQTAHHSGRRLVFENTILRVEGHAIRHLLRGR